MSMIIYFKSLILYCICMSFPLTVYLIYIAYTRYISDKEKNHFFSLAIILSLMLMLIFNVDNNSMIHLLMSTPLLLCYISKREKLSFIISLFLIFYYSVFFKINIFLLIIEFSIYLFSYLSLKESKYFYKCYTVIFLINRLIFIGISNIFNRVFYDNILLVAFVTTFLIIYNAGLVYLFIKNKKILEITSVLNQLEKEEKIKASIFKLNHEIKNPLAVCSGYLEMMPMADDKKKEKYLNIISEEIKRSLTIMNDFASIGKIKKLDKEELDLAIVFEDIKAILSPLYEENNGTLTIPDIDELYISGDYNRLKQVLVNILKNSLEAKKNNTINVNIRVKKIKDNYRITITDDGIGMTKKELEHIYDMFYTTKSNGSGIGIPYIKEIIELHKGTINYKSQKNKGTTVIITLPTERNDFIFSKKAIPLSSQ